MNASDLAIDTALKADTGAGKLVALSNGGFYQKVAPETTPFNYTIYECLLELPDYAFGNVEMYRDAPYQIRHYSVDGANNTTKSGQEMSGAMDDRCRVVLHNATLSVSGKTLLFSRFERSIPLRPEWDESGKRWIIGKGSMYRICVC